MPALVTALLLSTAIMLGLCAVVTVIGRHRKKPRSRWLPARVVGLVLASALGYFLFLRARSIRTNYWLLKDARQGMAVITAEHWSGHNTVIYEYRVDQKSYTGHSGRNWQDEKYRKAGVGDETIVYYSASHPWLSLLSRPRAVVEGLPVLAIVLVLEVFTVFTIIRPQSKWALNLSDDSGQRAA